jgi:dihydroneopterin aldolase
MESDAILLRSFRVMAYCGVLDEEQARRQPFEINAEVFADLRAAGQSDDLNDTINYGVLGEKIAELVEKSRFALLEYFAQQIADLLLGDTKARQVTVEILKLRPPMAQDLAASGVRITRTRS